MARSPRCRCYYYYYC